MKPGFKDSIIALQDSGKNLRNRSQFDEALRIHSLCAQMAESCEDTIDVSFSLQNQWIIRTSFVDKRNSATLVRMPKC